MLRKIIVLFASLCSINLSIFPEEADAIPGELRIFKSSIYEDKMMICSRFFPVGFSKDGKFAYADMIPGGGRSNLVCRFSIMDLIEDRVLYEVESEAEDVNDFSDFWRANYGSIKKKMNEYGIIENKPVLSLFPCKNGKDQIKLIVEKKSTEKDPWERDIGELRIIAVSSILGKKTIYRKENSYIDVTIEGYIRSPYEDRILVIVSQLRSGWEGPPDELYLLIAGCHLTKGFVR
jgi:hypothetical protein